MTAKQFYKKWDIKYHNKPYYKRILPQFILPDGDLDYGLMDKEFKSRQDLKFRAREELIEARGIDIHECFSEPYSKEKACNWLVKLYMEPICEKSNKKLIEARTVTRINKVLNHYLKGKTND